MAAQVTIRGSRTRHADFNIPSDGHHLLDQRQSPPPPRPASSQRLGALEELPVDQPSQRFPQSWAKLSDPSIDESTLNLPKLQRCPRRRPPIDHQTFEPLAEPGEQVIPGFPVDYTPGSNLSRSTSLQPSPSTTSEAPSATTRCGDFASSQIHKQLTGQWDWVVSYPLGASRGKTHLSRASQNHAQAEDDRKVTLGCNLWSRKSPRTRPGELTVNTKADSFIFLATPLENQDAAMMTSSEGLENLEHKVHTALSQKIMDMQGSLMAPDGAEPTEEAVSPSLTQVSERSSHSTNHASRGDSFSVARIEDSLAELDKLEDDIEEFSAVTGPRRAEHPDDGRDAQDTPHDKSAPSKRVTIAAGQSATVRVRPSAKARPALRRSNSLSLRETPKEKVNPVPEQKAAHMPTPKGKATSARAADPRAPVRSTKPLTVPSFQLPGEAVSLRLKEQREARKAQQAEAQKPAPGSLRPRSSKPLTKPTFELPGEAISRRKREEREARLKAQEEEERKRREFKARPIRQVASTLPRDTVASRARQVKVHPGETPTTQDTMRSKRLSTTASLNRIASGGSNASIPRGRNSIALGSDDASRGTSASTSMSEKRSSVSMEDVAQQRARAREIYARDNSYTHDREQEKRERESAAKLAREQAAERSRAASREWAEKQRRKRASIGPVQSHGQNIFH